MTFTVTTWPERTTSRGSETNFSLIAETWTRPSWWTPTSTKAPNAATLVTVPSRIMPGVRWEIFSTPSLKVAVRNSGRGSRPGLSSSAMMSVTVGTPKVSSAKSAGRSPESTRVLPISSDTCNPVVSAMRATTG